MTIFIHVSRYFETNFQTQLPRKTCFSDNKEQNDAVARVFPRHLTPDAIYMYFIQVLAVITLVSFYVYTQMKTAIRIGSHEINHLSKGNGKKDGKRNCQNAVSDGK